jgi:hypothetical protein
VLEHRSVFSLSVHKVRTAVMMHCEAVATRTKVSRPCVVPPLPQKYTYSAQPETYFLRLWRMPSSWMRRRVDLVRTDVSEERIASTFRVEKSMSEEPAWAGGCRLSHQSKTPSYIITGRAEEGPHEKSVDRRGEGSVEMGQQIADQSQYRIVSGGKKQGYRASIDPITSGLSCRACIPMIIYVYFCVEGGGYAKIMLTPLFICERSENIKFNTLHAQA